MLHSLTNPRCVTSQKREDLREITDNSFYIDKRYINALSVQNTELMNVTKLVVHKVTTEIWRVSYNGNSGQ
jgi:hypothetical protein